MRDSNKPIVALTPSSNAFTAVSGLSVLSAAHTARRMLSSESSKLAMTSPLAVSNFCSKLRFNRCRCASVSACSVFCACVNFSECSRERRSAASARCSAAARRSRNSASSPASVISPSSLKRRLSVTENSGDSYAACSVALVISFFRYTVLKLLLGTWLRDGKEAGIYHRVSA